MRPGVAGAQGTPRETGIANLRAFLVGPWRLARVIDDRRTGRNGALRGHAEFAARGEGLCYREAGRLRLGAHAGRAVQSHLYDFPRPGRAVVRFAHGRTFHDLDLTQGRWEAVHLCGEDTYRGAFQVSGPEVLTVRWTVSGPRKGYVTLSRYRRAPVGTG